MFHSIETSIRPQYNKFHLQNIKANIEVNYLAAGLIVITFVLLTGLLLTYGRQIREALLVAILTIATFITLLTESLSLIHALNFTTLLIAWLGVTIGFGTWLWYRRNLLPEFDLQKINIALKEPPFHVKIILELIVIVIVLTGIVAVIYPPNTWDAMTYHMTRVFFWQQYESVAPYPTVYEHQIIQPPFAEYAILQLQILSGGDGLANLVQWTAMLLSLIGVSLIARELGATPYPQIITVAFCVALPMGVMQSSSTQNDYVIALWIVILVYFVLNAYRNQPTWAHIIGVGLSGGLATLTKGTGYLFMLPWLFWFGLILYRRWRWQVWKPVLSIGVIGLSINAGFMYHVYSVYDTPLNPPPQHHHLNRNWSASAIASNIIRNTIIQIYVPEFNNENPPLSRNIYQKTLDIHHWLDIAPNDSTTTMDTANEFLQTNIPPHDSSIFHEDYTTNTLHLGLFWISLGFYLFRKSNRKHSIYGFYLLALVFQFIFFNMGIKWSLFNVRLQLPLFVLMTPIIGLILMNVYRYLAASLVVILLLIAMIFPFLNHARPLIIIPRADSPQSGETPYTVFALDYNERYFVYRPQLYKDYMEVKDYFVKSACKDYGIYAALDWVYPLVYLIQRDKADAYFQYMDITNATHRRYQYSPYHDFRPCLLINFNGDLVDNAPDPNPIRNTSGHVFIQVLKNEYFAIYAPISVIQIVG